MSLFSSLFSLSRSLSSLPLLSLSSQLSTHTQTHFSLTLTLLPPSLTLSLTTLLSSHSLTHTLVSLPLSSLHSPHTTHTHSSLPSLLLASFFVTNTVNSIIINNLITFAIIRSMHHFRWHPEWRTNHTPSLPIRPTYIYTKSKVNQLDITHHGHHDIG